MLELGRIQVELLEEVLTAAIHDITVVTEPTWSGSDSDADLRSRFLAAWNVVVSDDVGHQISLYELTLFALRRPELRDLARRQYELYRTVAGAAIEPWRSSLAANSTIDPAVLAQLIAVVFDGTALAWLADPEGTDQQAIFELLSRLIDSASLADGSDSISPESSEGD